MAAVIPKHYSHRVYLVFAPTDSLHKHIHSFYIGFILDRMFHLSGCLGRGGRLPIVPDFNLSDSEEQTALELALCTGQMSVASRLLEAGANIEVQTTSGLTLLHKAIRRGDNAAALFLLENGADINNRYSPGPAYPSTCNYSQTSLYGHLIITDSLLCPWGNKALTFLFNSTRLVRTLSMAPQCPY